MAAPFACDLTVFTATERGALRTLVQQVFDACDGVDELADGYRLRFPGDANNAAGAEFPATIVEWVTLERRCCPCIAFTIEFPEDRGPLAVRLTGRPGIKPFLLAEFKDRIAAKLHQ